MDKYHRQVAVVGAVAVALIIVVFLASRLIKTKLTQG
jgi:hypothetical protein